MASKNFIRPIVASVTKDAGRIVKTPDTQGTGKVTSTKIRNRLRVIFPKVARDIIEEAMSHTYETAIQQKQDGVLFSITVARNYIIDRLRYDSKFVSWDDALIEGRRELLCHISDAAIDFDLILKQNFDSVEYNAIFDFVMWGSTLRDLAKDHPPRSKSSWQRFLMFTALPLLKKKLTGYGHRK